jgi:hypothetical protein
MNAIPPDSLCAEDFGRVSFKVFLSCIFRIVNGQRGRRCKSSLGGAKVFSEISQIDSAMRMKVSYNKSMGFVSVGEREVSFRGRRGER